MRGYAKQLKGMHKCVYCHLCCWGVTWTLNVETLCNLLQGNYHLAHMWPTQYKGAELRGVRVCACVLVCVCVGVWWGA